MSSIRTEIRDCLGILVLSRAATLNALTLDMLHELHASLQALEAEDSVKLIMISSDSERAFCAGGDMKRIREACIAKDFAFTDQYFQDEYALNLAINRCRKPYLALIDGVAMGGGLGLSVNGRFRVVTENAVLAMPESRIGFFPDVGASHFLPRLPHRCGYWLALTAASVKGSQAVMTGLATHHVPSGKVDALMEALSLALKDESISADNSALSMTVTGCLDAFCTDTTNGGTHAATCRSMSAGRPFEDVIATREAWFADDDLKAIRHRLQAAAGSSTDAAHLLALLDGASPYSLDITLALFRKAQGLDLAECLKLEYELAREACRHPDLVEGVRAVLVDKDRHPVWMS